MDEKRLAAALDAVENLKRESGLSQEKAGKLIGVSGAVLSTLRSGTYKGDVERQVKIIEDYFAVKDRDEFRVLSFCGSCGPAPRSLYL